MELKTYRKLSEMSRGIRKAPLVFKNACVVNVFTEEVLTCDVAVAQGIIVGVGTYEGEKELDLTGKYLCPGFIDSHLHLESTLITPGELISQAAQTGTTTFIVDPHESANVSGTDGIDYILEQTEKVPANVYVMMPSCVPATRVDDNGCTLSAGKMKSYLENPRILGLGEVMDVPSVVEGSVAMHEKLELFKDRVRDGHAPSLSQGDLNAYVLAGVATDHECVDYEYAMEERRKGMQVLIREGSAAKNLEAIVKGIVENNTDTSGFCFCTDDKHIEDIREEGHINYNVRKAVSLGLPVHKAIKMATLQAARCYGLRHLGAIAPGYQADLLVLEDLENLQVLQVYHQGEKVVKDAPIKIQPCNPVLKNTVHLSGISVQDLILPKEKGLCHVLEMIPGQIFTRDLLRKVPGDKVFEPDETYKKIAVIERHKGTGRIGIGVVTGFGIRGGAAASSVSHDSHNLIVIGDNDADMVLAVNELIRTQGGYTIVQEGAVYETLPLPIMGLMSDAGFYSVNEKLKRMIHKAHEMGIPEGMDPFITLSFMALPVIPSLRVTPRGVYQVEQGKILKTPFERETPVV